MRSYTLEEIHSWPISESGYYRSPYNNAVIIHSTSIIERGVKIGANVRINENAVVRQDVTLHIGVQIGQKCLIGEKTYIGKDVLIEHDCYIGRYNMLRDRTTLGRNVKLGDAVCTAIDVTLGDMMIIKDGLHVEKTPTYIIGSMGDPICWVSPTEIMIGCNIFPVEYWQKHYEKIAIKHLYTQDNT